MTVRGNRGGPRPARWVGRRGAVMLGLVSALGGLGSIATARAAELTDEPSMNVGVVNTLSAEAWSDNGNRKSDDDDFGLFLNRLNLSGTTPSVTVNGRLDGIVFAETPTGTPYRDELRVQRLSAEVRLGDLALTVGDSYVQLGRGILLSLRKVDEVGLDVALRGAEVRWSPEGHSFLGFAGVVDSTNLDVVLMQPVDDTGDVIAGGRWELGAVDGLTLGVHGLYVQPADRLLDTLDSTLSGGLTVDLPELVEGLSLYSELAVQNRALAGQSELGTALYLTADYSNGDLGVLFEGLRLSDLEQRGSRNSLLGDRFEYNLPPTLERFDQEVQASRNVTGGRLRAELAWLDAALTTHVNGLVRVNDAGETSEVVQLHGYVGAELRFDERTSKLSASTGYRSEANDAARVKSMLHFDVDLVKALGTEWSLHVTSTNELRTLYTVDATAGTPAGYDYLRGSTFLGADWTGHGSLTFELGYDDQDPSDEVRSLFLAGILGARFGESVTLRATAGTQRGGLKCVAGDCRLMPPFAGVKTELVVRL